MSPISEEHARAIEQRLERLEHMASINKKEVDNNFWILMGVTFITLVSLRTLRARVDDLPRAISNRQAYDLLMAQKSHQ